MDEFTKFLDEIFNSEADENENTNCNIVPDSGKDISTDALSSETLQTNIIVSYIDEGSTIHLNLGPLGDNGNISAPTSCSTEKPTTSASGDEPRNTNNANINKLLYKFVIIGRKTKKILRVLNMEDDEDLIRMFFPQLFSTGMTGKTNLKRKASSNVIDPQKKVIMHKNIKINQNSNTRVQPSKSLLKVNILPMASRGSHIQYKEEGRLYHSTQLMTNFDATPYEPRLKRRKL